MANKSVSVSKGILITLVVLFLANFIFSLGLSIGILSLLMVCSAVYYGYCKKRIKKMWVSDKMQLEDEEFELKSIINKRLSQKTRQVEGYEDLMKYVFKLRRKVQKKVRKAASLKDKLGSETINYVLEDYIKRIMMLVRRSNDLQRLMDAISVEDVRDEVIKLRSRLDIAKDSGLKVEYKKTIRGYIKHLNSHDELYTQREMVGLRIRQAVVGLEQFDINCTRFKEVVDSESDYIITEFQRQGDELSEYVDNLNNSYRELDREL